jgi:hypothetical protein
MPAALPPAAPVPSADGPVASGERPFRVRRRQSLGRRAVASLASPFVSRRARHAAAGALHRAEGWLRQTEPERGEL